MFAGRVKSFKSLLLQDKCNIEIFLSPEIYQLLMPFNHTDSYTTSLLGISDSLDISITYISYSYKQLHHNSEPRSAVGNVSGYRCVSDCRSRGREFDPGPVPYFRGD